MLKNIKGWAVLKGGIRGQIIGSMSNITIQKNNVLRLKKEPKKK